MQLFHGPLIPRMREIKELTEPRQDVTKVRTGSPGNHPGVRDTDASLHPMLGSTCYTHWTISCFSNPVPSTHIIH